MLLERAPGGVLSVSESRKIGEGERRRYHSLRCGGAVQELLLKRSSVGSGAVAVRDGRERNAGRRNSEMAVTRWRVIIAMADVLEELVNC